MFALADKIPDENVIGFLLGGMGIVAGTIVVLTAIAARAWSRTHHRNVVAPLLREMIERGMNTGEITAVFDAAFDDRPGRHRRLRDLKETLSSPSPHPASTPGSH